jgi:diguanylate cyclase (GGDEF)-like protein/PAS domain S-box-containing protein
MKSRSLSSKRKPHTISPFAQCGGVLPCGLERPAVLYNQRTTIGEAAGEREEQYRLLFESNPVPMWVFDRDTLRFLHVNHAAMRQYGYTEQEFLSMTISDIRPTEDIPALLGEIAKRESGLQEPRRWTHCRKDGSLIDVEVVAHSIEFRGANAELIAANDVTERNHSREVLFDSESKYRALFEESGDAHWLFDNNGISDCNVAALKMFGFEDNSDFTSHDDISPVRQADGRSSKAAWEENITSAFLNRIVRFEWLHQRRDGQIFNSEVTLTALTTTDRKMLMATVRDITQRKETEAALILSTELLKAESESTVNGILAVDESNRIILANKHFARHFDIPEELLESRDELAVRLYVTARVEDPDGFAERINYLYQHPDEKSTDEVKLRSGKIFERYSGPLVTPDGCQHGRVWYFHDITKRKEAEAALLVAEQRYRVIFENAVVGIFVTALDGRLLNMNRAMVRIHGYDSPEELLDAVTRDGKQLFVDPNRMAELHSAVLNGGVVRDAEVEVFTKDHSKKWVMINLQAERDGLGNILFLNGTTEDITSRKIAEERVQFLAYFDALTSLPNRTLMKDRLVQALATSRRRHEGVAVMCVGLDRFKFINDSLGHTVGDLLLKVVAQRIKRCIREQDTVARIGGDEFVIILPGGDDASQVASRIQAALSEAAEVGGQVLNTTCSIGISVFPDHANDAETLIKFADQAMYYAKEGGRNAIRLFSSEMDRQITERTALEKDLRRALDQKEFFLVYQPQITIADGELAGFEALIRWQHPQLGLVPPDKFIGLAESTGLILPIGEWVLRTACAQGRRWIEEGLLRVPVAVNVSAVQFRQAEFCELVKKILHETGLPPQYLELELTESLLLTNQDVMLSVLAQLKEMGVKLAIDDFGTGYSSLSYLKQFRVDKLKIDRSFIRDVSTNADDAAIATAIINMAKSLKLKVIAEGVEDDSQLAFLRALKCDEIQGYYISKPLTAREAADKFLWGRALNSVDALSR